MPKKNIYCQNFLKGKQFFLQKNTCRELFNKFSFFSKNVNFFLIIFFYHLVKNISLCSFLNGLAGKVSAGLILLRCLLVFDFVFFWLTQFFLCRNNEIFSLTFSLLIKNIYNIEKKVKKIQK